MLNANLYRLERGPAAVVENYFAEEMCIRDRNRGASFKTFASACVERKILSALKSISRQKQMPAKVLVSMDHPAGGYLVENFLPHQMIIDPEERLIDREDYRSVLCMMDKILSDLEHKVFQLYLSGRSYQEISADLGLSEKSVDNALQRIRRKLRKTDVYKRQEKDGASVFCTS